MERDLKPCQCCSEERGGTTTRLGHFLRFFSMFNRENSIRLWNEGLQ